MYPGRIAKEQPDRPAFVMAATGEAVTYGELDRRSNRLAHLLRAQGLQRLGHYAVFMENNSRFWKPVPQGNAPACITPA
jgi:long-chain acyl-CoA synthetase